MRQFSLLHPLVLSFFSPKVYRDVAGNWKGFCLPYLLSLLGLCIIPGVLQMKADISSYIDKTAPVIISQLPQITIVKGIVNIDCPEPYYIKDSRNSPFIIIDTTGQIVSLEATTAVLLLKGKEIVLRQGNGQTVSYDLSEIDSFSLTKSMAYHWLDDIETLIGPLLYLFTLFSSYLYNVIALLIYSVFAILLGKMMNIRLGYQAMVRLSAIAMTPSLILGSLIVLIGLVLPLWILFSVIITLGYLFYGIKVAGMSRESG